MSADQLPKVKAELLGQTGVLLLPVEKMSLKSPRGESFEHEVHDFLFTNFNGYTVASGNISGHWSDEKGRDHYGEHRQYKIALPNRDAIRSLEVFIATLARELKEECIYFELADAVYLIYAEQIETGGLPAV